MQSGLVFVGQNECISCVCSVGAVCVYCGLCKQQCLANLSVLCLPEGAWSPACFVMGINSSAKSPICFCIRNPRPAPPCPPGNAAALHMHALGITMDKRTTTFPHITKKSIWSDKYFWKWFLVVAFWAWKPWRTTNDLEINICYNCPWH